MDMTYKKRAGTSANSGQLYETKLISLILFRLLHDDSVEEFYLASNMDEVGAFDDICFRVKITGYDRPILIFIQAKHKEDEDTHLKYDLFKHLNASFFTVRQKFYSSENIFFNGNIGETDCVFILYTNANFFNEKPNKQARKPYQSPFSNKLNELLVTSDKHLHGFQVDYTDEDLDFATEKLLEEEITALAIHLAKFLKIENIKSQNNQSMNMLHDNYILRYHVILAHSIVDISETKSEKYNSAQWRDLTFRRSFFDTDDRIITMFRKKLCHQIIKDIVASVSKTKLKKGNNSVIKQKEGSEHDTTDSCIYLNCDETTAAKLISSFLSKPSALTLSALIGTHIAYDDGNLKFIADKSNDDVQRLKRIDISQTIIDEAEVIAARNILLSVKLKVPITFGNIDLTIRGNNKKVEKRLNILTDFIEELCKKSQLINSYILQIDKSVGDGLLRLNGGIGGSVGNILVYDKTTKLLKFTENPTVLENNAKALFYKLNSKVNNLHLYRFDVKTVVTLPKLVFDYTDEAKQILSKAVVYDKQCSHIGVEALLKGEIENHQKANGTYNYPVNSHTIFIQYHDEIQKRCMSQKTGIYFIQSENVYRQAINNIITEPQISAMQTTFNINNMKYLRYNFCETAIKSSDIVSLHNYNRSIIVTNIYILTIIKVIQCLRSNNDIKYVVLELEYVLSIPDNDFCALRTELMNTEKMIIVVCDSTNSNRILHKKLDELAQAIENKKAIVISNSMFVETAKEYFPCPNFISDEKHSLIDLNPESQRDVLRKAQIIFQGQKINFDLFMLDELVEFINGAMFNKIFCNKTITIGKSLSNSTYEKMKHLYVDRRISKILSNCGDLEVNRNHGLILKTFHDINDNFVLIASSAGMGKSTLLTHLSLKTKVIDNEVWIVRINLLEYSAVFYKWQKDKTVVNTLEMLKFLCHVILKNKDTPIFLKEINSKVVLARCAGDEWASFELNLFLHFYNKRRLIFLFDGFDEICPNYKDIILKIFDVIKKSPLKHKLWVTSRPYIEILLELKTVLSESYEIDYMNEIERGVYLNNIWHSKLIFKELSDKHIYNIISLLNYMSDKRKREENADLDNEFFYYYTYFYNFVHSHFPRTDVRLHKSVQEKLDCDTSFTETIDKIEFPDGSRSPQLENFMGTPLHLYLLANYIVNLVCVDEKIDYWEPNINICIIYEMFIENKLRTILFQDKNNADITKPGVDKTYDKQLADIISMHKRLAAYYFLTDVFAYEDSVNDLRTMLPFDYEDSTELADMINAINSGTEKTGLISHVTEYNVPVFIHRTFTEYFAAEYVYDILKSDKFGIDKKGQLLHLFKSYKIVLDEWFAHKMKIDKDFEFIYSCVCSEYKKSNPCSLLWPLLFIE